MYNVSQSYINILKRSMQIYYSKLRINISNIDYSEENILQGSFSINNQCSESSDVMIGSVFVGELVCTLINKNLNIPRNTWNGRIIKPYYRLKISENTYEEVPLGVFVVDEATYSSSGIEIKAYDYMTKFDKKIVLNQSAGSMYSFLNLACNSCGMTLGMTQQEVQSLPNGSQALMYYSDNDVKTWRDFVSRIAQLAGGFASIDRSGSLIVRTYSQNVIDSVDIYHRVDTSKFSDYVTSYTGMSYTSKSDNHTHYHGLPDDTGLTMNLGINPFLQDGTQTYINIICDNILNAISNIQYVPHETTVGGNPAYDLGDVIEYVDGLAGTSSKCCVMAYNFTYHNGFSMQGFGKDPALSTAQSKVDKNISGLLDRQNENQMIFTSFTNAEIIDIGDGNEEEIINIKFAAAKAPYLIFNAEILCEISTTTSGIIYNDAAIKITYIFNGNEIETYHPTQTVVDGKHIINLMYIIPVDNNIINTWKVKLEMNGGSIVIPADNCRATIYGQGLVATDEWDGYIDFEENISGLMFTSVSVSPVTESITTTLDTPLGGIFTETFNGISFTSLTTQVTEFITAYITERGLIDVDNPPTYDTRSVEVVDNAYVVKSGATTPQYLVKKVIDVADVTEVLSTSITGANITLQFSDDGEVWKSYVNNVWQTTQTEMTVNDVNALTSNEWLDLIISGVLWVRISLNVSNSSLTKFEIIYTEGVYEE